MSVRNQVGGDHYKKMKIEVVEFCHANNIPFNEGSVIKYICRWRAKGGLEDLKKAKHYIDIILELEERKEISIEQKVSAYKKIAETMVKSPFFKLIFDKNIDVCQQQKKDIDVRDAVEDHLKKT